MKGRSARAVVFTEISFEDFDDMERHLLLVGCTRASMHLELVIHTDVVALLAQRLGA